MAYILLMVSTIDQEKYLEDFFELIEDLKRDDRSFSKTSEENAVWLPERFEPSLFVFHKVR